MTQDQELVILLRGVLAFLFDEYPGSFEACQMCDLADELEAFDLRVNPEKK